MAAATVYNSEFFDATSGLPNLADGKPLRRLPGGTYASFTYTIATTSVDDAGDRVALFPLPHGAKDIFLLFSCDDLDGATPALDADLVLREDATDTIVFNGGTAFQAAQTGVPVWIAGPVSEPDGLDASIDFLVNTAAGASPISGDISVAIWYS